MFKKALLLTLAVLLAGGLLAACSSPEKKQRQATEEFQLQWQAREFMLLCKGAVQPGMTPKQVMFQWGAPGEKGKKDGSPVWTYQVEDIMYFRGWHAKDGARGHGLMVVTFAGDKVSEVREVKHK